MKADAPVTLTTLRKMKREGEKIVSLTAYDATFARLMDELGIDVILVGDSLGMVIKGEKTTVPVSMDEIVYHSRCVLRGCRRALLMADMPFLSYTTAEQALRNAARLMQEGGAQVVKLEASVKQAEIVRQLADHGVPVCAHLGLQPQFIHKLGGYKVQGRGDAAAQALTEDAKVLEQAGADLLLLECVPAGLAASITASVDIPVIGIGAGSDCDGQVLVLYDMLGITSGKRPKFSKDFMPGARSVQEAIINYAQAVKNKLFPAPEHTFN